MKKHIWYKVFPGAITVTDHEGTILEMNDKSAEMFKEQGGYALLGSSAIDCHQEPSRSKVKRLYDTKATNIYTITKNGKKRLVFQTPFYLNEVFAGFVELSINIPEEIPHFNRDQQ